MPGIPGKEQFRRAITELRNLYVVAGMFPLMTFRTEVIGNDEFMDRGGADNPTRTHFEEHLLNADRWRRRVTHNPDGRDLGQLLEKAIDPDGKLEIGPNPFGGDDIQNMSGGKIDLPWRLDGTDPDIPLNSQIKFNNGSGMILLGAIDRTISNWTRCNSRDRTAFITTFDSLRIYGEYQAILGFIRSFMGDDHRVDVAQVLPSDEPLGPTDSPNRRGEAANNNAAQ